MSDIRQVVCAIDFSEVSQHALSLSTRMALQMRLPLKLIHVVAPLPVFPTAPEAVLTAADYQLNNDAVRVRQAAERLSALRLQAESAGVSCVQRVIQGVAGETLVDYMSEESGIVLVMGTHGYQGLERFFLGSTAISVIRRASCPVIAVREWHNPGRIKRIGVAIDFSASCVYGAAGAARLAKALRAELQLLHIMPTLDIPVSTDAHIPLYAAQVAEATKAAYLEELGEMASHIRGVEIHRHVILGTEAHNALAEAVKAFELDLCALGTHGRRGLSRLFLGSVTERLLRLSATPILAVRQPEHTSEAATWRDCLDVLDSI